MNRVSSVFLFLLVAGLMAGGVSPLVGSARGETRQVGETTASLPAYRVEDPSAAPVTAESLVANERFWPYMVGLTRDWRDESAGRTLRAGTTGVLIRVDESGALRVDFGRDGLVELPASATDVVERANAVRLGKLEKKAPNFTWAIGARILDSRLDEVELYGMENALPKPGFLAVFVDPTDTESFEAIARALAPLNDRDGVLTVVFPQGRASDGRVLRAHKEAGWEAAFVLRHLAEPYTATLLPAGAAAPYVMLQTNEGRVIAAGPWRADMATDLEQAIDRAFGAP